MEPTKLVRLVAAAGLLAACSGTIESTATDDGPSAAGGRGGKAGGAGRPNAGGAGGTGVVDVAPTDVRFACDANAAPVASDMRRLSKLELANTVRQLAVGAGLTTLPAAVQAAIDAVPDDSDSPEVRSSTSLLGSKFRRLDHSVSDGHVEAYFNLAQRFAEAATASTASIKALAGDCAVDADAGNDAACFTAFAKRFGAQVLRRPPRDAELAFWQKVVADKVAAPTLTSPALRDAVTVMLAMPSAVYHIEDDGRELSDGLYELSPYELASRLSYLFWQAPPDDALLAAAADGSLRTDATLRAQAQRLFEDPRTAQTVQIFFEDWMRLAHYGEPWKLVGTPQYDTFRGAVKPTPELRQHMVDEALALAVHAARNGGLVELLTSTRSFARTADVASLYGVPVWDGSEANAVTFPPGERSGLLTRTALVASDIHTTRPILKGVLVRRHLLCDAIPDPPPDVPTASDIQPPFTRRQDTAALTERKGTACAGCHTLMNGFGYATENYDALGRLRKTEPFIDASGKITAQLPVDTRATVQLGDDEDVEVTDGVDLSARLAKHPKVQACFARHYVRFALARAEDTMGDGCALEAVRLAAAKGSLEDAFVALALDARFRLKRRAP